MAGTEVIALILNIALVLAFILIFYAIIRAGTRGTISWIGICITGIIGLLLIVYLWVNIGNIEPANWAQIIITTGLVVVTSMYAWSTQRQAKANEKMAKEMREQRVMVSRPIIIQKAVVETETKLRTFGSKDWFAYFEIYNEGNGPAIELEMILLNEHKSLIESARETILRANEPPIKFLPSNMNNLKESVTHYLLCQYQSILSNEIWYQTWFPFETVKSSKTGKIYVKSKELIFIETNKKGDF